VIQKARKSFCWLTFTHILGAILLLAGPGAVLGQGYGSIRGTVNDPSSAVIPSATINATQSQTGRVTTVNSGKDGGYVFPTLAPAAYSLTVSAPGFETYTQTGIVLQANQALTVNVPMKIGSSSQSVSVSADAPLVDTTTGTLSQVIDEDRVNDLPLNGRNAAALTTLVAGAAPAPADSVNQGTTKQLPVLVLASVNGARVEMTNYMLDGGNNVDELTNVNYPFPFPDALQEFSVQTSNYSAEFGQSAGAVVNIVTKAGGEKFHGDAFEFVRNGYFNAKPFFATKADNLHRHQFGGSIGGPVIIPHMSQGKNTQFFFGYQHTLVHQNSSAGSATVPTPAEEGIGSTYADFGSLCSAGWNSSNLCSSASQQIINPFTNKAYPLNQIPNTDLDPAAMNFLKDLPTASGTPAAGKVGGLVNYFQPTIQSFDEYVARGDHSFGANDHFIARYYQDHFKQVGIYQPNMLLSYGPYSDLRYQNALISETHTFTSNLLNSFVANYLRMIALRGGPPGSPDINSFGVNIWQPAGNNTLLGVSSSGYFSVSSLAPASWNRGSFTIHDDLHWVKGKHSLAFGGVLEKSRFDLNTSLNLRGSFTSGIYGNYVNALANYELGYLTAFSQGQAGYMADHAYFPGLYAQDSWHIQPKLTLNYGIRWEEYTPWHNKFAGGAQTEFSPANYAAGKSSTVYPNLPAGMLESGDAGVLTDGFRRQYNKFMPRAGFAYDLSGNGKTVVRGGGGLFFEDRISSFSNYNQSIAVPYTIAVTPTNLGGSNPGGPFSNPYCTGCTPGQGTAGPISNPFPYTLPISPTYKFNTPIGVSEFDLSGKLPASSVVDYNLTIERQLAASWVVRIAYIGSQSRHLFYAMENNPAVNTGSGLSTNQRRSYNTAPFVGPCAASAGCATSFSTIDSAEAGANAHYNSGQVTLEKKMSHGLSILANYVFSKNIDDLPEAPIDSGGASGGGLYALPVYPAGVSTWQPTDFKALDRGLSDEDHPHVVSISYVYELPKLRNGNSLVKYVLNGWRTSGLIQHSSGDALTLLAGKDISLTGLGYDRPQQVSTSVYNKSSHGGNCAAGKNCYNWINASSFQLPVNSGAGTGFGNMTKGTLRGPAYTDWDGAVIRTFPILREAASAEFRAEYFDLLNHTILGDPATSVTSSTFGEITSAGSAGPRIAQFSLKIIF